MSLPASSFWIVHVFGCLVAGALAWGLGVGLQRWLRISHASRNYWLGLWLLAAAPAIIAVALDLWAPAVVPLPAYLPLPLAIDDGVDAGIAARTSALSLPQPALLLAALYLAGVGVALLAQLRGALAVRRVLRASTPVGRTRWPGQACAEEVRRLMNAGIGVRLTAQTVSPFAVSWPQPVIVLPATALERFSDRQLHMVIRHEAAHLLNHDPQRAACMRLAGAVLWFDPFVRLLAARVQMAAELRCDAWALQVDTAAGRDLASAYVDTLRMDHTGGHATMAFAGRRIDDHLLRLRHMLGGDPDRALPLRLRVLFTAMAIAVGGLLASMQAALADPRVPVASSSVGTALHVAVAEPEPLFSSPVPSARVSSHFQDTGGGRKRAHNGMDLAARRGTDVLAPADGIVVAATMQYPGGPRYGTVVVLDHGHGWQTLYAHLDSFDVTPGQQVKAGERIAGIGTTGETTGPHVHVELLRHGQRIDPEPRLR
ncbi:M23/M56 family metallopeptidase [Pseudoxanthomonas daejeonensis]|uniref:M23/M56 family metallopeptidase n=1 Tax=Pseudoxanthomonas daejeonensis TaxID=266062 RepID=UPI001F54836A|nr:M23/M56 family metallopeptidase [Pseudoxanthomonas daejeonensis]UNK58545.1 M23/M56 family metallopeptidase [Pseudoxanthomonas daejeonensis]